jgi:hypothetical protein
MSRPMTGLSKLNKVQSMKSGAFPLLGSVVRPMTAVDMRGGYATSFQGDFISQSELPIDLKLAVAK